MLSLAVERTRSGSGRLDIGRCGHSSGERQDHRQRSPAAHFPKAIPLVETFRGIVRLNAQAECLQSKFASLPDESLKKELTLSLAASLFDHADGYLGYRSVDEPVSRAIGRDEPPPCCANKTVGLCYYAYVSFDWPISDVVSEIGISHHVGHGPRSGARTPVRSYCEHLSEEHGVVCGRHSDRHPNSVAGRPSLAQ